MAWPVEDGDREVTDRPAGLSGDDREGVADGGVEVDLVSDPCRNNKLLHVDSGPAVEHGPSFRHPEDTDRVGQAFRGQGGAVNGVDGDVDGGAGPVADPLAVEQYRRLVLLAFADDDDPVHADRAEDRSHGVHGSLVDLFLVTEAEVAGAGDCGGFGSPHQLEGKVAVGVGGNRQAVMLMDVDAVTGRGVELVHAHGVCPFCE